MTGTKTPLVWMAGMAAALLLILATPDQAASCGCGYNYIYGTSGNDNIVGTDSSECIFPGKGDNTVDARGGCDLISEINASSVGTNTFYGGKGADFIYGGDGPDTIYGETGPDFIDGLQGNDTIGGYYGNDLFYGSGGDDDLWGGQDHDVLYANDGNDTLRGNRGVDFGIGDAGTDSCNSLETALTCEIIF